MVTGSTGPGLPARIAARSRCRHGNDDAAHLEDFRRLLSRWQIPGQVSHLGNANLHCAVVVLLGPCDVCVGRPTSTDHLCRLDSRPVSDSSDTKSTSRRCHNVWHGPRSNGMRRESTGAHFTLKLAESGRRSVGGAWFKSPLAHNPVRGADFASLTSSWHQLQVMPRATTRCQVASRGSQRVVASRVTVSSRATPHPHSFRPAKRRRQSTATAPPTVACV
jgi:hypothetical protein